MAGSDLNIKFTNEKYMTRAEVAKALGTNLIDQIWREIILYRRGMSVELPIYDNASFHFSLTQTPKVISLYGNLSERVNTAINLFDKLVGGSISKYTLTHDMLKLALRNIAKVNKIDVSEITLQNIIDNNCNDSNYKVIINYYRALEELLNSNYEQVNDDFLAKYYAILKGQEELTSYYRENDNNSVSSRFLVGAEYNDGVQADLIEDLMAELILFVNDNGQPLLTRIVAAIYMFNYIKPFNDFNLELSVLVVKSILISSGLSVASIFVPIEIILNNGSFFGEVSKEVQRSRDFTFALLKGSESIIEAFNTMIDRNIQVNAKALEQTINMGDDSKKFKEEFGFEPKPSLSEPVKVQEVKPEPIPSPVVQKEQVQPAPAPAPKVGPVIHPVPAAKAETVISSDSSEKELRAREKDILEFDPYIKKAQAHFYVRHCTKGKFYTIQEYKKFEGCVYETARTSMDNLAYRGYYRREQIKNKFVYTPIDKE